MKHKAKIAGQLRHVLGIVGAGLIAGGYAEETVVTDIIGGLMALTALILSWISPAKKIGEGDFG